MNKLMTIIYRFTSITLAKILAVFLSVILVAGVKYMISGSFQLDYSHFFSNAFVGLVAWTLNESLMSWFTYYLGIKGVNFRLKEILFGFHTINGADIAPTDTKIKLYLPMESDDSLNDNGGRDEGKKVDKGKQPYVEQPYFGTSTGSVSGSDIKDGMGSNLNKSPLDNVNQIPPTEPAFALWSKVFPGLDPLSIFPKRINPGPGFNVPGGVVPIRDEICRHIDYNTHILKQFRTMDLEVAIEQRNNNLTLIRNLDNKLAFAQNALSKIPAIPTTEYEFRLKNKIISDLNELSINKERSEGRVTLLNSRIEFIQISINK